LERRSERTPQGRDKQVLDEGEAGDVVKRKETV
jgi:hypothetical protein